MQEPMRVAQMMTDMKYGGVEMVVMNYYRHIDRSKVQFDFIALEGSSVPQREEIEKLGGRVYLVPKYTHPIKYQKAIQKIFKENKYKIVHCHMNTLGVFALYGAKKCGINHRILHNHSTAGKGETKKNIMKYILRPFAKIYPTQLCACSQYAGEWIYGKNTKFTVWNNAIELGKFVYNEKVRNELRKELGIEDKFVIGHVGRFCYQKNHALLIDIFKAVLQKEKAILLLIGEGELFDEIKAKVDKLCISENVIFLGNRTDAYLFYQAMDLFLLPSKYEGLPVVGVETQASGLPCVMSKDVTGETKILDTTVFVDLEASVSEWVDTILSLKNVIRKDTTEKMQQASFDIKYEAGKLLEMYYRILDTK